MAAAVGRNLAEDFVLATLIAPVCTGRRQSYPDAFRNQLSLKFGQYGENAERQVIFKRCRVDRRAMPEGRNWDINDPSGRAKAEGYKSGFQ